MTTLEAQRMLIALCHLSRGEDDGIFGTKTRAALAAFQKGAGISAHGILDEQTAERLAKVSRAIPPRFEPPWLIAARGYVGHSEIAGRRHAPFILRHWVLIRAPFTDDETPWCAGFVGGVLEECGIRSSRSAAARSYLSWGQPLLGPVVGCIVVFERGPHNGHVGFAIGQDRHGNLLILGGNQGDGVRISPFARSRMLGCRWPAGHEIPTSLAGLPVIASAEALSSNEA